jgi:hypothetical protein
MPAAGPYGIEQFDAAGIINNYQAMQHNRIQMMILQKELQKSTREEETAAGVSRAIQAYTGGGAATTGAAGAAAKMGQTGQPAPADASTAAPGASPYPSGADREKLFGSLLALDPKVAGEYMDAFSKMDKAQLDHYGQVSSRVVQFAGGLLQLPQEQRAAALQQITPEAQQLGYTPDQLAQVDLSDAGLRQIMVSHMDADKIAQFVKPEYHPISQGGSLVETGPTGQARTVYETPTVEVGGDVYPRPLGMSGTAKPMTATNPKTGQRIQLNPQTGQWEPVGGAGGNASGGFQ